jgi:outer membrane lipoprotein SlyB
MSRSAALSAAVVGLLAMQGCAVAPAGPSVLVLPGPQKTPAQFQADQAGCQQQASALVAPGVEASNNQAAATAVIGTAIGAAVGALIGYGGYGGYGSYANQGAAWGAGAGLMYGGALGSSYSQASNMGLQQRYDNAFAQCMVQSGNQMPGVASYRRAVPAVPPPPPGYRYPPPNARPPSLPPPNTPPPAGVVAPA